MLTSISSTPSTPLASPPNLPRSGAHELRSTRTAPSSPRRPYEMLITGSFANGSALRSGSPADRDLETQRRLLGADVFVPSPESPLHHLRATSPLSEASHLQDEIEQESIRERAARSPARSMTPVDDTHDHPSEGALGLFFAATAPSRIQHPPLPPLEEELPLVPTTRSRASTVPQPRAPPAQLRLTPHPLFTPRTTRVYPQPHVVEIAREKIGSAHHQQPSPSPSPPPPPSLSPSPDVAASVPLPQKESTRKRFFGLWKETVAPPHAEQTQTQHADDDVLAVWEREQRRAHEMTLAAALDNKPRFAFVTPSPTATEPISRVSSTNSTDDSPAETDHPDDCRGVPAFFRSLFHRRTRSHLRRTPPARAVYA